MPRKLLYAGRLLYWKGVHIAIEAMSRLVTHMPDAHLTIVGNGPEETRLKSEIAERNLEANITLVPWMPQEQFLHLYDTHDVFVFPSLHDSAGWVVLESLAEDCRSLASISAGRRRCNAGVRNHRRYDGAGYIRRCAKLAEELRALLADPERLATLSAGAIARAREFLLRDQVERLYAQATEHLGTVGTQFARLQPELRSRAAGSKVGPGPR